MKFIQKIFSLIVFGYLYLPFGTKIAISYSFFSFSVAHTFREFRIAMFSFLGRIRYHIKSCNLILLIIGVFVTAEATGA